MTGGGGSKSFDAVNKKTLGGSACVCLTHTRVGAGAQFPSLLLMIDSFQRFSGKTKLKAVMGGQCQQPVFPRWVKAVEQGSWGSGVQGSWGPGIQGLSCGMDESLVLRAWKVFA